MPSGAKDALSEATTTLGLAQGSQPGSAFGAEIPVTIHASRYSAASKGTGKLPPVHEETRTVIIFPQGAVVRLSAMVTPGELVVLTNKRTGADVICRVTSVKTQPGIQNYVHLEFTQRALDFWEETPSNDRGNSTGKVAVIAAPLTAAPAVPMPPASGFRPSGSTTEETQRTEKSSGPAAVPKVTPLADIPAADSQAAPKQAPAAPSKLSEITESRAPAHQQPHAAPFHSPRLQPFEPVISQDKKGAKAIGLFAIAAVVLLAIGIVGGSALLRPDRGVVQQFWSRPAPSTRVPLPVPSESERPISNASGKASSVEPVASTSPSYPAETPAGPVPIPALEPPKAGVQPQSFSRPNINVSKILAPKVKRAAPLNSSEPPPLLPADANGLPGVIGESVVNTTAHSNPPPPAEPAPAAPVKGGQLQQPKLLSSVAAAYPPLARAQRVQGEVTIDALIDATGKVAETKVISGNALLQKAAVDSLRLRKYQPALLNGEPIPIHINVTIVFHLQ